VHNKKRAFGITFRVHKSSKQASGEDMKNMRKETFLDSQEFQRAAEASKQLSIRVFDY